MDDTLNKMPRLTLCSWIRALAALSHAGVMLLASIALLVGLILLFFSPYKAIYPIGFSLYMFCKQVYSRIVHVRFIRQIRQRSGILEIFDRESGRWVPATGITGMRKEFFLYADPWRPITLGYPGIELSLEGASSKAEILYPYGLDYERDRLFAYLARLYQDKVD